jgi:hypothetical protein
MDKNLAEYVSKQIPLRKERVAKTRQAVYHLKNCLAVKRRALDYKGSACSICGYSRNPAALHFHHEETKAFDISAVIAKGFSFDEIRPELDRCVLVCANCHTEIHWPDSLPILRKEMPVG